MATELTEAEARTVLLGASGLGRSWGNGEAGVRAVLGHLGCIQLDPIDRVGTNADLVAFARVDGLRRGDVHTALRGVSFEHFAKERCILDARFFPLWRGQAIETPWWRHHDRMRRLDAALVDDVLAEVQARGPVVADEMEDRGRTEPMDWSGWKGTGRLTALALEVLWTRCQVVASGRDPRGRRVYDVPSRALGAWADASSPGPFAEVALIERVRTAGLLSRAGGANWSMLADARTDGTVERLLEDGRLVEVRVGRRPYLMLPQPPSAPPDDGAVRILGPLDSLLWDRALLKTAFGFDYVWEIYKPADKRVWGYYVCPILQDGALVGRVEARRDGDALQVEKLWGDADPERLAAALERLAEANGCTGVVGLPGAR